MSRVLKVEGIPQGRQSGESGETQMQRTKGRSGSKHGRQGQELGPWNLRAKKGQGAAVHRCRAAGMAAHRSAWVTARQMLATCPGEHVFLC